MTHEELEAIEGRRDALENAMGCNPYEYAVLTSNTAGDIPALIAEVKRLTRERDVAVSDLKFFAGGFCSSCKHFRLSKECEPCNKCSKTRDAENATNNWQWRGVQEADDGS